MKEITLIVYPESKKAQIIEKGQDLSVFVRSPAQNGLANYEVREMLARHFAIGIKQVVIISGLQSQKKRVRLYLNN